MSLLSTIKEDLAAHGNDWTRPGFQSLAVHRFGNWQKTIKSKVLRTPFHVLANAAHAFTRNFYGIELPFSAKIGRRVVFEHQHGIIVHGNCSIGDDCILRQGVTLGMRNMSKPFEAPVLGNNVSIGAGAKILGNVRIYDNVDIGTNSVVLNDVPRGSLAVGAPARIITQSFRKVAA